MRSRHCGGQKYNVYIKYQPKSNNIEGIESWYCTCKAGMRTVGCCSHVASIVYFLSHGKYLENIPNPGSRLSSIFPVSNYRICGNKNKIKREKDQKNEGKVLKKTVVKSNCLSDDDTNDSLSEFDDGVSSLNDFDDSTNYLCESDDSKDCFCDSGIQNSCLSKDLENINESMKRLLSTDIEQSGPNKRSQRDCSQKKPLNDSFMSFNIDEFRLRIPKWGGLLVDKKNLELGFSLSNTCTIDYFLLCLWTCTRLKTKINDEINRLRFPKRQDLIDIITSIEFIQWNKAKSIWIQQFLFEHYDHDCDCAECMELFPENKFISTFGSEYEFFLEPLIKLQEYDYFSFCSNNCNLNGMTKKSVALTFEKENKKVNILFTGKIPCRDCHSSVIAEFSEFKNNPPWLFIQTNKSTIYVQELPKVVKLGVKNYQFLCSTILLSNHFRGVFYLNNEYLLIDDLNSSKILKKIPKLKIVTCFYYCIS
jgi:hypothetical protein